MSTRRIVLLAALGLLALSGVAYGLSVLLDRSQDTRATVSASVHRIVVRSDVGDVDIRAGLTRDVTIDRHDAWVVNRPKVSERYADGVLTIRSRCGGLKSVLRCRSDLRIDAPPEVDVQVRATTGDVDLRGLSGRADIETDAGDIRTHRLAPVIVRAAAEGGDVSLDLFGDPVRAVASTNAGDVQVTVPYGPYHVDADARSGDVRVEGVIRDDLAPQAIDADTHTGDITVRAR